jgi:regulator of RNase E activity RraA
LNFNRICTSSNKVLVDGSRYTEVRVGDFLLADTTGVVLQNGQMARKLTRVLSKDNMLEIQVCQKLLVMVRY